MLISELSRRSGVPVATIKYYLREGLLPPGEATAATRAEYGERHLIRLRLIRALADVGNLPLAAIRRILTAVDSEEIGVHELLGTAQYALGPKLGEPTDDPTDAEDWRAGNAEIDALLAEMGWRVSARAPARAMLARALVSLRRLDVAPGAADLRPYAEAAQALAHMEIARIDRNAHRGAMVERAVVATVLYEPILVALRRLAQEHESARRFAEPAEPAE